MNAISARQKTIGPVATSMNGRRRPSGVWNVSLHGPTTSGRVSANRPSAARTSAISVVEPVNSRRIGGRYADVVVSDHASPSAPAPRTTTVRATDRSAGHGAAGETAADDLDDGALGRGHLLV